MTSSAHMQHATALAYLGERAAALMASRWVRGQQSTHHGAHPYHLETNAILASAIAEPAPHLDPQGHAAALHHPLPGTPPLPDVLAQLTRHAWPGLDGLDMLIALAVGLPRFRPEFGQTLQRLATSTPGLTEELVADLVPLPLPLLRLRLALDAPLRRFDIVHGAAHFPHSQLRLSPAALQRFSPNDVGPPTALVVAAYERPPLQLDQLVLPPALREAAQNSMRHPLASWRLLLVGRTGSGRKALAASLAMQRGLPLGLIHLTRPTWDNASTAVSLPRQLREVLAATALQRRLPVVTDLDTWLAQQPPQPGQAAALRATLTAHPGPLILFAESSTSLPRDATGRIDVTLEVTPLPPAARRACWLAALGAAPIDPRELDSLASQFALGAGEIHRLVAAAQLAPTEATWPERAALHVANEFGGLATQIVRLPDWASLVLPADVMSSVYHLRDRMRHHAQVFERWGFAAQFTSGQGLVALFSGPPGTGKTMAAGALARSLGLPMFRVDVANLASRWIGETAKNLGRLFDAAEAARALLLFDEADSLFGKRTVVKTSNDRYANAQVNYLLQRLDGFTGIAVLTSNAAHGVDAAFARRLTSHIRFPLPDAMARAALWRSHVPDLVRNPDINFEALAAAYTLAGGYIRNIAMRAAFYAAQAHPEDPRVAHEDLCRAAAAEYVAAGNLSTSGSLE